MTIGAVTLTHFATNVTNFVNLDFFGILFLELTSDISPLGRLDAYLLNYASIDSLIYETDMI